MFDPWEIEPDYTGPPAEYRLTFGRHNGRKLGEAFRLDPDYFRWLATRGPTQLVQALAMAVVQDPPEEPFPFLDPYIDAEELARYQELVQNSS